MNNQKILVRLTPIALLIGILIVSYLIWYNPWKFTADRPIRILHIDSYHLEFWWSIEKIDGYRDYLDEKGIAYELQEFYLDSIGSDHASLLEATRQVRQMIDQYEPDLIFANDDKAQEYVSEHYLDQSIPWVFSGLNKDLENYGFHEARNTTGLLEKKPTKKMFDLIKKILPQAQKMTLIGDQSETGKEINGDVMEALEKTGDYFEIVHWYDDIEYFEDVKAKITEANQGADFVIYGSYWRARDAEGLKTPSEEVSRWIVENSNIPEVGFWKDFVRNGGLLSVETDPYVYGREAAKITEKILIKGEAPSSIRPYVPESSRTYINLARAQQLGLQIPSMVLINSEVIETFPWE